VAGEAAEEVRPQHRRDHRAEPAAGLARDAAVLRRGQRAVAGVDEGHDLVADVGVVPAGARGVDELAAAVRGPRVDEHDEAGRCPAGSEELVGGLGEGGPERRPVVPHREHPGVALQHVDARVAPVGLVVVARWHVDLQRPVGGIAERVVPEQLAPDDVVVEAAGEVGGVGQRHRPTLARTGRSGQPAGCL
jgi:hypothetical protein